VTAGDALRVLASLTLDLVVAVGGSEDVEELVDQGLASAFEAAGVDVALEELGGELVDAAVVGGHAGTFSGSSKNRHEHRSQRPKAQKCL
jgi:hypothetical protein